MSTTAPAIINLINGVPINPFSVGAQGGYSPVQGGGSWSPSDVAYMAVYNNSPYPVMVQTLNGPMVIEGLQANVVATGGATVSISSAPYWQYPPNSNAPVYLGTLSLIFYDNSEAAPVGFPAILSPQASGYQLASNIPLKAISPQTPTVVLPPGYSQILLHNNNSTAGQVGVGGANSGIVYYNGAIGLGGSVSFVVSANDTALILYSDSINNVDVFAYEGVTPVYTVTVPQPVAGSDWNYTLPAPARLVGVDAQMSTSAAVANRTPFLQWGAGATVGNSTPIVASQTSSVHFATGYVDSNYSSGGVTIQKTGIPSLLLPAGTIIKSVTLGLQATDQWFNVALTFSAE